MPAGRPRSRCGVQLRTMTLEVVIHKSEEGGYWAEIPALPACATQAETISELLARIKEAAEGWLAPE